MQQYLFTSKYKGDYIGITYPSSGILIKQTAPLHCSIIRGSNKFPPLFKHFSSFLSVRKKKII